MGKLSKTALASLRTETGDSISRTAIAWVFERKPGKMQTKPYATFYRLSDAELLISRSPLDLFIVAPLPSARGKK